MSDRAEIGKGKPAHCWHCGRQLQRAPGHGLGLFYFRRVVDRGGFEHRVHTTCVAAATADGDANLVQQSKESSDA